MTYKHIMSAIANVLLIVSLIVIDNTKLPLYAALLIYIALIVLSLKENYERV